MSARPDQMLITLRDGQQVLVDLWPSGEVEVSRRAEEGGMWTPLGVGTFGGRVEVIRAAGDECGAHRFANCPLPLGHAGICAPRPLEHRGICTEQEVG